MRTPDGRSTVGIPYSNVDFAATHGYGFANDDENARYTKDRSVDPKGNPALDFQIGFERGAMQGVSRADAFARKHLPAFMTESLISGKPTDVQGEEDFANNSQTGTLGESAGVGMENVAEFLLADSALKGLSYSEKLAKVLPALKSIEKSPRLFAAVRAAMAAAGVTAEKTGDPKATAISAVTSGATAGVGEYLSGKLGDLIRDRGAIEREIAGVKTPISGGTREAANLTPQQQAGQQAIRNVAQDATERNLNDLNASRTEAPHPPLLPSRTGPYEFRLSGTEPVETAEGESVVPARKKHIGTTVEARPGAESTTSPGRGVRKVPKFQYLTGVKPDVNPETVTIGGGGEMRTTDINVAERHLDALNEAIDSPHFDDMEPKQQQQLLDTRDDMRQQMREYQETERQRDPNFGKPQLEPVNVQEIKARTNSLSDFADNLEDESRAGYRRYDELTQNRASAVKRQMKDAWRQFMGASGTEAKAAGENAIVEADRAHQELMNELSGSVSTRELKGLDTAYRRAKVARAVATAVDSSFSGNPSPERAAWESWGFNGNTMLRNLNRAEQKLGRPALEEVYGRDGLNSLYEIAQANVTPAQRKAFGAGMKAVAENMRFLHGMGVFGAGEAAGHMMGLPWGVGGATSEVGYLGVLKVWGAIQSNPKIAQNFLFAIDSGANPKNYGPIIANMVATQAARQMQNQQGEGQQ